MPLRWVSIGFGLLLSCASIGIGLGAQRQAREPLHLDLEYGASLRYPSNWSLADKHFANASELVVSGGRAGTDRILARTLVTAERQKDHSVALRQLADVSAKVGPRAQYRTFGGWPAMERRHLTSSELAGEGASAPTQERVLRLTTAIAAGDVLVRLETIMMAPTPLAFSRQPRNRIANEAIALGRSVATPTPGNAEEARKEIMQLSQSSSGVSIETPTA